MTDSCVSSQASTHRFLREATRALHDEVEACSPLGALSQPGPMGAQLGATGYVALLQDLHEILDCLEPIAEAAVLTSAPFVHAPKHTERLLHQDFFRRRLLLDQDLTWLDAPLRRPREALTALEEQLSAASREVRFGLAYVLMGQSLGTAVISRSLLAGNRPLMHLIAPRLAESLEDTSASEMPSPFAFFAGYGKRSSRYWSLFLEALEEVVPCSDENALQQALLGAKAGFGAFLSVWGPSDCCRALHHSSHRSEDRPPLK